MVEEGGWASAIPAPAQVQGWDLQWQINEVLGEDRSILCDRQDVLFKLLSVQHGRCTVAPDEGAVGSVGVLATLLSQKVKAS